MTQTLTIISLEEFKKLDKDAQKQLFERYEKEEIEVKNIAKTWGCKSQYVYNVRSRLGVSSKENLGKTPRAGKTVITEQSVKVKRKEKGPQKLKEQVINEERQLPMQQSVATLELVENKPKTPSVEKNSNEINNENLFLLVKQLLNQTQTNPIEEKTATDGLSFQFKGTYTSHLLEKKLNKVLNLIKDETSNYEVKFELIEKENNIIEVTENEITNTNQDSQPSTELKQEIDDIQLNLLSQQEELETIKQALINNDNKIEIQALKELVEKQSKLLEEQLQWANGYNSVKSDKVGLHKPESEYTSALTDDVKKKTVTQ